VKTAQYEEKLKKTFDVQLKTNSPQKSLHLHKQYEVMLILSENTKLRHENEYVDLHKNCLVLRNNTDLHSLIHDGKSDFKRYILYFLPEIVLKYSTPTVDMLGCYFHRDVKTPYVLPIPAEEISNCYALFDSIEKTYNEENLYGKELLIELQLCQILLKINGIYKSYHNLSFPPRGEGYTMVYKVIDYIHSHYSEDISVSSIAQDFYVQKANLHKIFHSVCGISLHQYIINYRLTKAKELLIRGYSVEEVGYKVGYKNLSSFSRLFKQKEKISPKQYQLRNC
jgi:AraC-like DNA-binding protein